MKILTLMLVLGLMTIGPVFAEDGNNVLDQIGDALSGKGNSYAGVEVIKDNLFGPLGLKAWADAEIGEVDEGLKRDVRGGIRLRVKL